jgi:hypothetical protein
MQAVARLPQLTELDITLHECNVRIPLGLFSNLSKLSVSYNEFDLLLPFFISQMATVIMNSPQLRFLHVSQTSNEELPTLSDLFANVSMGNPLFLEHLSIIGIDATVTRTMLPHLTHLASFEFQVDDEDLAACVWTNFLDNKIKLSDVVIRGAITGETVLYLASFSGLKRLSVSRTVDPDLAEEIENMLFAEVLPKHVDSLQTLEIMDWVNVLLYFPC